MPEPNLCAFCGQGEPKVDQLPHYHLNICTACTQANAGGWLEQHEPLLRQALASAGLFIPDRNADGRLPFRYAPPSDFQL